MEETIEVAGEIETGTIGKEMTGTIEEETEIEDTLEETTIEDHLDMIEEMIEDHLGMTEDHPEMIEDRQDTIEEMIEETIEDHPETTEDRQDTTTEIGEAHQGITTPRREEIFVMI